MDMNSVRQLAGKIPVNYLIPSGIMVGTALLVMLLILTKPKPPTKEQTEKVWPVLSMELVEQANTPNLLLYGKVESANQTTLKANSLAYVKVVPAEESNQNVASNTLLVELNPIDAQLSLDQRRAQVRDLESQIATEKTRYDNDTKAFAIEKQLVELSNRAVNRQQGLTASKLGTESQLETLQQSWYRDKLNLQQRELAINNHINRLASLQAKLSQAQALAQQAEINLQRMQIRAPFSGRISKVHVSVGDQVSQGAALVELYDIGQLEVRAQIPDQYIAIIQGSLNNDIFLKATTQFNDTDPIPLLLTRLASEIDRTRGGVDAFFIVEAENPALEIGRSISVLLELPVIKNSFAIPLSALYGNDRIYLIRDSRLHGVQIKRLGSITSDNTMQLIVHSDELKTGDTLLASHLPNAMTGLLVQ